MSASQIHVERVGLSELRLIWPWLGKLLLPAIAVDKGRSLAQVEAKLFGGEIGIATVHVPNGAGVITLEPGMFDGVFACWVPYVAGRVKAGPHAWVDLMRGGMDWIEARAREAGCAEVRIGGRNWSRALPAYERFNSTPNMLRKVL